MGGGFIQEVGDGVVGWSIWSSGRGQPGCKLKEGRPSCVDKHIVEAVYLAGVCYPFAESSTGAFRKQVAFQRDGVRLVLEISKFVVSQGS